MCKLLNQNLNGPPPLALSPSNLAAFVIHPVFSKIGAANKQIVIINIRKINNDAPPVSR